MGDRGIIAASGNGPKPAFVLKFRRGVDIYDKKAGLREPSGLTSDPNTGHFWTVSDDTKRLFCLDHSGQVISAKSLPLDARDLEGIAWVGDELLAAVREKSNEVLLVAADGRDVARRKLKDMDGYHRVRADFEDGRKNKGIEGITADRRSGALFLIKEGEPRLLLKIAGDLSRIDAIWSLDRALGFRASDPEEPEQEVRDIELDASGLAFDASRGGIWILSDVARSVFLFDLRSGLAHRAVLRDGTAAGSTNVVKPEGIALDSDGQNLHVVTDAGKASRLLSYKIQIANPPDSA